MCTAVPLEIMEVLVYFKSFLSLNVATLFSLPPHGFRVSCCRETRLRVILFLSCSRYNKMNGWCARVVVHGTIIVVCICLLLRVK